MAVAPLTDEQWRWAETLAIEKAYGSDAPRWIAEQIGAMAIVGDFANLEHFMQIAACFERMLAAGRSDAQ